MNSILSDIDVIIKDGDKISVEFKAKQHANWKQYSINILPEDEVRIFFNDSQSGARELSVCPELLRELFQDAGLEYDGASTYVDSVKELIRHISDNPKYQIIRIIHSVGQGTMCSERFLDREGNTDFLAVYDCGSDNSQKLRQEITASFSDTDDVDLLFVSHLDNDHVNGIKKLKETVRSIKTIILPLFSESQKAIYLLLADDTLRQIVLSPEVFFSGSNIVKVRSVSESLENHDFLNLPLDNGKVLESCTPIRTNLNLDWCYIPYNYDESTRVRDFYKRLADEGIAESSLSDSTFIDDNRDRLKGIYKKICSGSVNDSSLVVYSGGCNTGYSSRIVHGSVEKSRSIGEACLYLGDANLNQMQTNAKSMVDDLKDRLDNANVNRHIGMLQLPHHGSVKNFHNGLLSYGLAPKSYFASFGQNNRYGHPSSLIAGLIIARNETFYGVTESRDSAMIQIVEKV